MWPAAPDPVRALATSALTQHPTVLSTHCPNDPSSALPLTACEHTHLIDSSQVLPSSFKPFLVFHTFGEGFATFPFGPYRITPITLYCIYQFPFHPSASHTGSTSKTYPELTTSLHLFYYHSSQSKPASFLISLIAIVSFTSLIPPCHFSIPFILHAASRVIS